MKRSDKYILIEHSDLIGFGYDLCDTLDGLRCLEVGLLFCEAVMRISFFYHGLFGKSLFFFAPNNYVFSHKWAHLLHKNKYIMSNLYYFSIRGGGYSDIFIYT